MAAKKNRGVSARPGDDLTAKGRSSALYSADLKLAMRCANGEEEAIKTLVDKLRQKLKNILVRRGANETLAEDLIADLWSDCLKAAPHGPKLLLKYSGKSSLDTWLATVLTHRWLDRVRRERRVQPLESDAPGEWPSLPGTPVAEPDLGMLLRDALHYAFDRCESEALVMLQLVHVHGISQRQVAVIWRVSEFKISRRLSKAVRLIRDSTMTRLREHDPLVDFGWEDVADLCSAADLFVSVAASRRKAPKILQESACQTSV
jgi:RNA polymerase sigma factor (sigma-70 family)